MIRDHLELLVRQAHKVRLAMLDQRAPMESRVPQDLKALQALMESRVQQAPKVQLVRRDHRALRELQARLARKAIKDRLEQQA